MDQCISIPARARVVPQREIDALAAKLAERRQWMIEVEREKERLEQERLARLQAARDAAAEHFFGRRPRPDNVTRLDEVRR